MLTQVGQRRRLSAQIKLSLTLSAMPFDDSDSLIQLIPTVAMR